MDNRKPKFDDMIAAMQADVPEPAEFAAAADRVRNRLAAEAAPAAVPAAGEAYIHDCEGFRALLPAYRAGTLPEARRTLVDDHLRECVACRKAAWRNAAPAAAPNRRPAAISPRWGLAAAAVLLLALAIPLALYLNPFVRTDGATASVDRLDGRIYAIADGQIQPLEPGAVIPPGTTVRTARGARAVLALADGSRLEMNERSELAVNGRSDGTSVGLRHGSVIVRAARQAEGRHLYVDTADCHVAVKGTIFTVTSGTKGSRVSVLEGEVWVDHSGQTSKLHPGHQVTTNVSIRPAALANELGWSLEAAQYQALLQKVVDTSHDLLKSMTDVPLRFDPKLVGLLPERAVVVAAMPNVSRQIADASDAFFRSVQENPELSAALADELSGEEMAELVAVIERFRALGAHLGDEMVVGAWDVDGDRPGVALLAEVKDAASLRAALADELGRLGALAGHEVPVVLVDHPAALPAAGADALYLLVTDTHLFASSDPESMRACAAAAAAGTGRFLDTPFGAQIAQSYADGAAWLFALDLVRIQAAQADGDASAELLGLRDARYAIVEQKTISDQPQLQLAVSFAGERRGIPAWLGEPASMSTLDFVSPDAYAAVCVVAKEPRAIVDELFGILAQVDPENLKSFQDFQSETGLDIRDDLAAPLSGEFLIAVDGPVLPTPAWKAVLQLDDPARFQASLERLLAAASRRLAEEGGTTLSIHREDLAEGVFYTVASSDGALTVHYAFHDGYIILAPSRALITQAIANRANGFTLPKSAEFQAALPVDRYAQFSAVAYQNAQKLAGSLAEFVPDSSSHMSPEELQGVREMLQNLKPMLFCAYGERDRIVLTGTGLMSLNPADWAKFASPDRMMKAGAMRGKTLSKVLPRRPRGQH